MESNYIKESFSLDYNGILEYQKNRYPMLMIDYVDEVIPGKSAKGYKNLTANDWFFKDHFPGDPIMQGSLQIDALVQMFILTFLTLPGNKGLATNFIEISNAKFKKKIVPGDKLVIVAELKSFKRGIAKGSSIGYVNDEVACSAEFIVAVPSILKQILPK